MGTTVEKIEYLNETKELIKQSLNDLGADIKNSDSFRSYVQKIKTLYEDWPKITEEGTFLSLNSTQEGKMKIELKGNTLQDGEPTPDSPIDINVVSGSNVIYTSNKNLLDISKLVTQTRNGITITKNKDNSITLNGTSTSAIAIDVPINEITLKENTTYVFSKNTNIASAFYAISLRESNAAYIDTTSLDSSGKSLNINLSTKKIAKYFRLYITDGKTFTNHTFYPMLEQDSTATTYEPHQGKELPLDLPVENLLDISKLSLFGNNTYLTSGSNKIPIKPNTTYTFSIKESAGQDGRISLYDSNDNNTSNYDQLSNPKNVRTFTTGANDSYLIIQRWYIGIQGATLETIEPQLEQGSKVNAYTSYGTTPIELCKIGDYQDYFYKEGNKWYLHKEIKKVIFDGSEDWQLREDDGTNYCYSVGNVTDYKHGILDSYGFSNYFDVGICLGFHDALLHGIGLRFYRDSGSNLIYLVINNVTTVNNLKDWLTSNNVTLYYVLATPTNTEITDTTLISQLDAIHNAMSYKEQTNILQENNDLPFILNISALQKNSN